jgi:hypothetical protein
MVFQQITTNPEVCVAVNRVFAAYDFRFQDFWDSWLQGRFMNRYLAHFLIWNERMFRRHLATLLI